MFIKDWKKEILTVPNLLSLFRLLLIPVYMVIYLNAKDQTDYYIAGAILAVSCLTDMIDGKIARHFNLITNFGKLLDPVADKATQFTLIVCLATRYPVLYYVIALFVVKEAFQLLAGYWLYRQGKILKGALISGKICTTVLFLSLIAMVIFPWLTQQQVQVIAVIDLIFMVMAFTEYAITYFSKKNHFENLDK
ncbi:MAG: CDP-alcohol phosphatidyltransferase family protein [Ruminococcaceae bacterium]|nr:CDP-alcohol phosphatidyltransferase family protein [Oscillospiraceae bacterium]